MAPLSFRNSSNLGYNIELILLAEDAVRCEPVSAGKFSANRENNREFCRIRPYRAIFARRQPANSMACREIAYATEQGILR